MYLVELFSKKQKDERSMEYRDKRSTEYLWGYAPSKCVSTGADRSEFRWVTGGGKGGELRRKEGKMAVVGVR